MPIKESEMKRSVDPTRTASGLSPLIKAAEPALDELVMTEPKADAGGEERRNLATDSVEIMRHDDAAKTNAANTKCNDFSSEFSCEFPV
jgi:hypothetical protein